MPKHRRSAFTVCPYPIPVWRHPQLPTGYHAVLVGFPLLLLLIPPVAMCV